MTLPAGKLLRDESETPSLAVRGPRVVERSRPAPVQPLADALPIHRPPHRYESWSSVACSAIVHGLILLGLAFIVWDPVDHRLVGLIGAFSGPEIESDESDLLLNSELEINPGGSSVPIEVFGLSQDLSAERSDSDLVGLPGGIGAGTGAGEGDGNSLGVAVPAARLPGHAVTKGSFSAWTEPEDPEPGNSYHIMILVQLPASVQKYRAKDLTGMVVGTDGWKQPIRFPPSQVMHPEAGAVQFQILVPGARKMVRDTIRIESKLLKEKQVLQLEF